MVIDHSFSLSSERAFFNLHVAKEVMKCLDKTVRGVSLMFPKCLSDFQAIFHPWLNIKFFHEFWFYRKRKEIIEKQRYGLLRNGRVLRIFMGVNPSNNGK